MVPCWTPPSTPGVPGLFHLVFSETSPYPLPLSFLSSLSGIVNHLGMPAHLKSQLSTTVREGGTRSPAHYRKVGPFPAGEVPRSSWSWLCPQPGPQAPSIHVATAGVPFLLSVPLKFLLFFQFKLLPQTFEVSGGLWRTKATWVSVLNLPGGNWFLSEGGLDASF